MKTFLNSRAFTLAELMAVVVIIAILAISDNVQATVDRLMKLGIKGIVDFTHTHFTVEPGVEVQQVDVVVAIQELVLKMDSHRQ